MVSQICQRNGELMPLGAPPVNAMLVYSQHLRTGIIELFAQQRCMIFVQLAFYCSGAYPILLSNVFIAHAISAFTRNSIVEPGIASLVFCQSNEVCALEKGFAATSTTISLLFELNAFPCTIPPLEAKHAMIITMCIQRKRPAMRTCGCVSLIECCIFKLP